MRHRFRQYFVRFLIAAFVAFGFAQGVQAQQNDMLSLMTQITQLAAAGRYGDAIPLARKLVSEAEKASGPASPLTALARQTLAQALQSQGQFAEAEALYKAVLAIREKSLGPNHPDNALPLGGLAQIALLQNRLPAAEQYLLRAIAIQERALGSDHINTAVARMPLGNLRHRQLRDAEALEIFSRSLEIFKKSGGQGDIMAPVALNNIAEIYKDQGRLSQSESYYREALSIQERRYGRDSLYVAPMLNNLGDLERLRGRFADAESFARRTLQIQEKALGPDHLDVAGSLNNLAIVFSKEGRVAEAEGLLTRALKIQEKALGPNHPDIATTLNNLADASSGLDKKDEAEALLRRSLQIREKSLGPNHPSVAFPLDNLVGLLLGKDRYSEAQPLARRSLALREAALGKAHPLTANSLNNLALILDSTGRHAEAEPLLTRALDIRSAAFGETHPDVANSLENLGSHYRDLHDWRRAYDIFNRAAAIRIARGSSEVGEAKTAENAEIRDNSNAFLGSIATAYELAAVENEGTAAALRSSAFETAQWVGDDRAANAISGMSARIAAGGGELSGLVRERQDLEEQLSAIDRALIAAVSQSMPDRDQRSEEMLRAEAASAAKRLEVADRKIAVRFPEYTTLVRRVPVAFADVQKLLGANEALLLFTPTRSFTLVWTVTRSEIRWHASPVGSEALSETVRILRCGLDSSAWTGAYASECLEKTGLTDVPAANEPLPFDFERAYSLYASLFGPVEKTIQGKELILVPSGALATLPFQVLLTSQHAHSRPATLAEYASAPWLAKRFATTVLPSVASLKALRRFGTVSQAANPFIGFGNPLLAGNSANVSDIERAKEARLRQRCQAEPQMQSVAARSVRSVGTLTGGSANLAQLKSQSPLPETAYELCTVAKSFAPNAGEVRLGAKATETELKSLSESGRLANFRIVHFATHGALSGQVQGTVEPGLILSPPDQATDLDDGYLTASEIAALKLNADWVVLSACNTAGAERPGAEAFSGVARAFFYAGARALLVSHWAVGSEAAVKLVTGTIAEMQADAKIGRAEALRRAMVGFIQSGASAAGHPAIWAPFVVVGEGVR